MMIQNLKRLFTRKFLLVNYSNFFWQITENLKTGSIIYCILRIKIGDMLSTEVNVSFQSNAFQPSAEESEYESMDEKLQDLLEAKEGVDEAAPDADLDNKYTKKRKYIRTKHGDLEGIYGP